MRKHGRYRAVSLVAMALVAILIVSCSPDTQIGEAAQAGVAEQVEVLYNEGVGQQCRYGGHAGEQATGSEGACEHGGCVEGAGEHSADCSEAGHEEGPGPGEESGQDLALTDVYDEVRGGARLRLAYDQQSDSFRGILQNSTNQTLCRARVEVHLSNGTELGPTNPVDLPAGGALMGKIPAAGETFDGWSAHAETSPCVVGGERSDVGEHGLVGEHGGEGTGEHALGGEHGSGSN
jgi:hypothetical protein